MTTTAPPRRRRRKKQPPRVGSYAAGSDRAIELVRGYIAQQQRVHAAGDAWKVELARRQVHARRRFV